MCLQEKVMIVNLSISQWTARKHDKQATKEVEQNHQASDAGHFNKLLINNDELRKIQKVATEARTFHYYNTLPWSDNGDRILPAANYFNYVSDMGVLKDQFEQAVQNFVSNYNTLINEAKNRLGSLFNVNDYPDSSRIPEKFSIRFAFYPVQDAEDFRVKINTEEINRIRDDIKTEMQSRVNDSVNDLKQRIKTAVKHMHERLSEKDAKFHDTLVSNIDDLIFVLPKLNFTNDESINNLTVDLKQLFVNVDQLRSDQEFRQQIAKKAYEILKKM